MNTKSIILAFVLCGCACLNLRSEQLPFDVRRGYCDNSIFYMTDRDNGWGRATNAILKTTDGGNRWQKVLVTPTHELVGAFFYDAKTAWAVGDVRHADPSGTNTIAFYTIDGGRTWSSAKLQSYDPVVSCFVSFPDKKNGWLMLIPEHTMNSSPGELWHTDDGGKTWLRTNGVVQSESPEFMKDTDLQRVRSSLLCGGPILFRDAKNGWLVGASTTTTPGYLFATHDGGAHWQGQTLPLPTSLQRGRMAPIGLPSFSSANGKEGTLEANLVPENSSVAESSPITYVTHNGGRTWQWGETLEEARQVRAESNQMLGQGKRIVQMQFVDKNNGWAVTLGNDLSGQLLRTKDGGKTWTEVQSKVQ